MTFSLSRLVKDTGLYSIAQIAPRVVSFLLLPIMARFLTAEDYGILGQLAILSLIATSIVNLGLNVSLSKAYFETSEKKTKEGLIWSSFFVLLAFNVLLFGLVFAFSPFFSLFLLGSQDLSLLINLSFASVSLSGLIVPFASYLKLEQKSYRVVALALIEVLLASGLSLYFVTQKGLGVKGPLLGQLIAQGCLFVLFVVFSKVHFSLFLKKEFWGALLLGLPFMVNFFGSFLMQSGTRFVLVELRGLEEAGIFFVSQTCAKVVELFVMGMMAAWLPIYAKMAHDREQADQALKKTMRSYVMVMAVPVILAFLLSKPLMSLLVPPPLSTGGNLVGILVLSQGIFGLYALMQPLFVFRKKTVLQVILEASSGVLGCTLAVILVPYFGKEGAAFSQLASSTFLVLAGLLYLKSSSASLRVLDKNSAS